MRRFKILFLFALISISSFSQISTIKDILGEVEEAPVKTTKEEKQEEITTVKEVIKFDKKTKTILECHGFGTQNDLGTFISIEENLLKFVATIKNIRSKNTTSISGVKSIE